jgi:abequosyltransferase
MIALSICIATYNRAGFIGETLDSILPQITDDVEVLVVDGASTDNTHEILQKYVQRSDRIRYVRLPRKGGVDHDYDKAVEFARGKMCWLFTDDDLLRPGAVAAVLLEVHKGYSLIIVNAEVRNKDVSRVIISRKLLLHENIMLSGENLDSLFQHTIPYLSFIGSVIIERELWLHRERTRYFGTEFIHVGVIFQAPLPAPALVIAEPYVIIRYGNAQWTSRSFEIWMFTWPKMLSSFEQISEKTKKEYKSNSSLNRLFLLMDYRAAGHYSFHEFREWLWKENTPLWWKTTALITAIAPSTVFRLLKIVYLSIVRPASLTAMRD